MLEGLWTPGHVSHVQGGQLDQLLRGAKCKLVVVDWFAPWCGPCQRIAPIYQQLAASYPGVIFVSVDTETMLNKSEMLAMKFGIRAFPTFTFHIKNAEKERFSGADPNKLRSTIDRLMAVAQDMQTAEDVRMSMSGRTTAEPAPVQVSKEDILADIEKADKEDPEPQGEKSVKLRAKRTTGDVIELSMSDKASAQHLRRKLARNLDAAPDTLRLIFRGKILLDGHTLASYGLNEDGLTVHVAVSNKAASASLGPSSSSSSAQPSTATATAAAPAAAPATSAPPTPAAPGAAALRTCLQNLESKNGRTRTKDAVQVMLLYVKNIVAHPDDVKYRSIRQGNTKFSSKIADCSGGLDCMKALGFEHQQRNGEPYLVLKSGESTDVMSARQEELKRVIDRLAPTPVGNPSSSSTPSTAPSFANPMGGMPSGANPFTPFSQPGNNFASMFGAGLGGGAGGLPPGMSMDMLEQFRNNPQMQNLTANMMQTLMQDPALMNDLVQAMSSGQDPMTMMMSNPRLMQSVVGAMADPSVQQAISSAMGSGQMGFGAGGFPLGGNMGSGAPSFGAAPTGASSTNTSNTSSTNASSVSAPNNTTTSNNNGATQQEDDDALDDLDDIYAD
mmetsp:Transcript_18164/g.35684  ORF Transcript_18164/g.35684 Transcript_18164/m.35684 type:complete len:616 (+) Transcript_18164:417-2264(+)